MPRVSDRQERKHQKRGGVSRAVRVVWRFGCYIVNGRAVGAGVIGWVGPMLSGKWKQKVAVWKKTLGTRRAMTAIFAGRATAELGQSGPLSDLRTANQRPALRHFPGWVLAKPRLDGSCLSDTSLWIAYSTFRCTGL
ncbi:hypothetical protein BT67DRAFT_69431 [Trichocladium antarcticum]|uniref:Uncharacterized protein n=1 Tax=Trichocladium antarcticum TaxID=1450529 RepID=A0AAN6UI21_9PEZI|nr:hypothetical protein BT67DRAFT_69431 [Trichocladium antarcticum]